jgi:hypothetical protein
MIAPGARCMIAAMALIGMPEARDRIVPGTSVSEVSACPVEIATSVPMEFGPPARNSASMPSSSKYPLWMAAKCPPNWIDFTQPNWWTMRSVPCACTAPGPTAHEAEAERAGSGHEAAAVEMKGRCRRA